MPDNFTSSPGVGGSTFAADEVDLVLYPRAKMVWGVDGVAVDASAINPLPVTVGNFPATQPVSSLDLSALAGTVQTHDAIAGATPSGQLMLAVRRDASNPPPGVDGDFTYLVTNSEGRLKVAGAAAQFPAVTGGLTAPTQSVSAAVSQASNVMVFVTGIFTGHNCTFEGSIDGGQNWFGVQALRSNANTIELTTGVIATGHAYAWELSVNALTNFRVRSTAQLSGTANWRITLGSYATEPIPAAQVSATQPVSGTVTANQGTMVALPAGANAVGDVGLQVRANATGAALIHHIVSAAATNVAPIKATAGRVMGYCLSNNTAAWRYVKLHNTAAAIAGVGVVMTIGIPPNGKAENAQPTGIGFSTAISRSIVTGAADADITPTLVTDVVGDIYFA